MRTAIRRLALALPITLVLACGPEADEIVFELQAHSFRNSEWSTPVHLDAPVNTAANEQGPTLSRDGLTLYFGSDRPGSLGFTDIWVAKRECLDCPWGLPVNVGPVNSAASESGPSLSLDGQLLFFVRTLTGQDIYVSRRADPNDDLGWGPPVALGTSVNTAAFEAGPEYVQSAEDGAPNFYFNRAPVGATADLFTAAVTRDGDTRGPATRVAELSDPVGTDQGPSIRTDGREIYFFSTRSGGLGGNDLYVSTRRSVHDLWSTPMNLGAPMNSVAADQQPSLSPDARVLIFASSRVGGLGGTDLWMSTRTSSGH